MTPNFFWICRAVRFSALAAASTFARSAAEYCTRFLRFFAMTPPFRGRVGDIETAQSL